MSPLVGVASRTFSSLAIPIYRRYFFGQMVSMSGTWVQSVAQMWLVYELTNSGVALGIVTALQFAPVLVAGMWGGVVADRFDKRRLLIAAQAASAGLALALGVLTATGAVTLGWIYALALALGCVSVVEVPARQSFVIEMVGPERLTNAVGLNSTVFTSARVIGPALAGVLIAAVGIAWCFFINAASFAAAIVSLARMDPDLLYRSEPAETSDRGLRAGLRYVWGTRALRTALIMMAVIGTLAFNFRILLPVMASEEFGGGAATFGALSAMQGAGTVLGALVVAGRARPTRRFLIGSALAYGLLILVAGAAASLSLELIALVPMGAAGIAFVATVNSTLQLHSTDDMRGRVMALYSVLFLGTTPIGSPLVGWVGERFGVRAGFYLSGVACLAVAAWALSVVWAERTARGDAPGSPDDPAPAAAPPAPIERLRGAVRYALRR